MFGACFYWVTMFMLYLAQPEPGLAVPMQRTVVERTRPVPNPVPREVWWYPPRARQAACRA